MRLVGVSLFLVAALAVIATSKVKALRIAAFNVQTFGKKKSGDSLVMNLLADIVLRYDIILIQEIRDVSGKAINQLLDQVNTKSKVKYAMVLSKRLGRTHATEQYAFLYKTHGGLTMVKTYQDPDIGDKFEREPFIVNFMSTNLAALDFVLVGIHVDPDDAFREINALRDVVHNIQKKWKIKNVIVMGDLNAGCNYLSKTNRKKIVMEPPEFQWLIGDDVDTTVSDNTHCAYDRFVVTGKEILQQITKNSAQVFYFDKEYSLSPDQAKRVSDHYPIQIEIHNQFAVGAGNLFGGFFSALNDLVHQFGDRKEDEL